MSRFLLLLIFLGLVSCSNTPPNKQPTDPIDISETVEAHGISSEDSTLIIRRLSDNQQWVSNPTRLNIRYSPASTSKIPHTLVALETGRAKPDSEYKWDGIERAFKGWDQDQTLTTAYRRSAVWVYQDIVSALGFEVMSDWLKVFEYGNHNIGNQTTLRTYWLGEPLEISAEEQISFLTRLAQQTLPLSEDTYSSAKPIFLNEKRENTMLYAKTGWMYDETKTDIGWFVGWIEKPSENEVYVFALNLDMEDRQLLPKRKAVVIGALESIGAWPN